MQRTHQPTQSGRRSESGDPTSTKSKAKRRPKTPKGSYTCGHCGVHFTRWQSNMRNRAAAYCSRRCSGMAQRESRRVPCAHCGDRIWRTPARLSAQKRQFCSHRCYGLWMRSGSTKHGYRLVTTDRGRMLEHRVVMEEHIGRPLRADEVVHHINGKKADNRIENLEIMSIADHTAHHSPISWNPDEVVEMRKRGMSYRAIGEVVGVTPATIRQGLDRRGLLEPSKMGRPRTWDAEEVAAMRSDGMTYREIAHTIGVSPSAIFQGLRRDRALALKRAAGDTSQ